MSRMTRWSMMCAAALLAASTARADDSCVYDGKTYSDGGQACQSGSVFRCDDGKWKAAGGPCPASMGTAAPAAAPGGTRTSMYENATVASGSSICKAGTVFRCDDGEWSNLGKACS